MTSLTSSQAAKKDEDATSSGLKLLDLTGSGSGSGSGVTATSPAAETVVNKSPLSAEKRQTPVVSAGLPPTTDLHLLMDDKKAKDKKDLPSSSGMTTPSSVSPSASSTSTKGGVSLSRKTPPVQTVIQTTTDLSDILDRNRLDTDDGKKKPTAFSAATPPLSLEKTTIEPFKLTSTIDLSKIGQKAGAAQPKPASTATTTSSSSMLNNNKYRPSAGTAAETGGTPASGATGKKPPSQQSQQSFAPASKPKTSEEIAQEKQDLLFRLNRMKMSGVPLTNTYTMNNEIDEIKNEYYRLKKHRDIQNSVKFQRKMMMAMVTGIEFVNTKFDPLDIKLDGWSENVHENLDEYDDVFEELHEKYKERAKMAPEMRLFMSLVGSAFMFHLTQSLFRSSLPMNGSSDLGAGMEAFPSPPNSSAPSRSAPGGGGGASPLSGLFNMMGGGGGGGGGLAGLMQSMMPPTDRGSHGGGDVASVHSDTTSDVDDRPTMKGPIGLDHIMQAIDGAGAGGGGGNRGGAAAASATFPATRSGAFPMGAAMPRTVAPPNDRDVEVSSSGYRRSVKDGLQLNI